MKDVFGAISVLIFAMIIGFMFGLLVTVQREFDDGYKLGKDCAILKMVDYYDLGATTDVAEEAAMKYCTFP